MKKILIRTECISLGQFLKFIGAISNGGDAKFFLLENDVKVNRIPENRRGKKLIFGDEIDINGLKYCLEKE